MARPLHERTEPRRGAARPRLLADPIGAVYGAVGGGFALAAGARGAAIRDARWPLFVAGVVLMVAGIVFRQWAVAVLGRLPAIGLVVRIRLEERVLLAGLGDSYRRFAETRKRLIPGVW
jgi:protein-S-isoprenylcysteine O-methyltransferase Ste14